MRKLLLIFFIMYLFILTGCSYKNNKGNGGNEGKIYSSPEDRVNNIEHEDDNKKESKRQNDNGESLQNKIQGKQEELQDKEILDKFCPDDPTLSKSEPKEIADYFNKYSKDYLVWNNCLYFERQLLLDNNLTYLIAEKSSSTIKQIGDDQNEWFRIDENGKLTIFLIGSRGCGGCLYSGAYLIIDRTNKNADLKFAKLPYPGDVINSPDNKFSIFLNITENSNKEKIELHLYDYLKLKDLGAVYAVPEDDTVQLCGDGCYISKQAVEWVNNKEIKVHLIKRNKDFDEMEFNYDGEPFMINVNQIQN